MNPQPRATWSARTAAAITPRLQAQPRKVRLYATISILAHSAAQYVLLGSITGNHRIKAWTLSINDSEPIFMNADLLCSNNPDLTDLATNADTRLSGQIINRPGIQPWEEHQRFPVNITVNRPITSYKLWAKNDGATDTQIFAFLDLERL